MATLIMLGNKGLNLDTVTRWEDDASTDNIFVWLVGVVGAEMFCGDERTRILAALTSHSMEF